jgi:hypothetical protein
MSEANFEVLKATAGVSDVYGNYKRHNDTYDSYVKYCERIGSPVMTKTQWMLFSGSSNL